MDEADANGSADRAVGAADGSSAAPWDGRRRHVVDRALDYAALAAQGLTDTAIARRRRKSRGYVSILRRLGQAIAELPPAELGAYRTPRIGFALAQRLVRADVPPAEIRAQLRSAAGGFSTHGVDYRRRGLRRSHVAGDRQHGGRGRPAGGWTWAWDATLFQQDPLAYVRAHVERLLALQTAIARRAAQDVEARAISGRAVGQPLAHLAAAVATAKRAGTLGTGGGTAPEVMALRQLAALRDAIAATAADPDLFRASTSDRTDHPPAPAAGHPATAPRGGAIDSGGGTLPPPLAPRARHVIPLSPADRARLAAGELDE